MFLVNTTPLNTVYEVMKQVAKNVLVYLNLMSLIPVGAVAFVQLWVHYLGRRESIPSRSLYEKSRYHICIPKKFDLDREGRSEELPLSFSPM